MATNFPGNEITIKHDRVTLAAYLNIPAGARGLVIFAHGSGSSRRSSRNQFVAKQLANASLATLLLDLLTPSEETIDQRTAEFRFDIPLLAERLMMATDWAQQHETTKKFPIGYFGASTGAAAALIAAARRAKVARAVVSRGGRPDLAGDFLREVRAPVLLIVGGNDEQVLQLNRRAAAQLAAPYEILIIPNATHLFEEPGTLEQAAIAAREWFLSYLGNPPLR
ncbi:MAG TPA: dienelactone hydrolase family protein [Candidatus Eremiobacteraceae bacterium]|nr:dienelactone hydrolase family protein [Candidatus Eremiobacteraceae bacterium]